MSSSPVKNESVTKNAVHMRRLTFFGNLLCDDIVVVLFVGVLCLKTVEVLMFA